jgi:hypothetical protein
MVSKSSADFIEYLPSLGRINFISLESGEQPGGPSMGQSFMYFGNNPEKFASVFSKTGLIVEAKAGPLAKVVWQGGEDSDIVSDLGGRDLFSEGQRQLIRRATLLHFCSVCGACGSYGFGVNVRAGRLGRWCCAAHRPGAHRR